MADQQSADVITTSSMVPGTLRERRRRRRERGREGEREREVKTLKT